MPPYRVVVKVKCFANLARRKEGDILEVDKLDDRFELIEDLGEVAQQKPVVKKGKVSEKPADPEPEAADVFG